MLKRLPLLMLALFTITHGYAQISQGGQPYAFDDRNALDPVSFHGFSPDNLEQLKAEDAINDQYKDIPYRFGANIPVSLTMADGEWTEIENGHRVWRLGISSPGAKSINFNFSTFNVPKGGKLFVYAADHTEFIGSFTEENMQPNGGLGVSLIQSDQIIIEYQQSVKVKGEPVFEIDQVTHGYRGILHKFEEMARGPFGNSGSCNINVACPESDGWEDQIRSVALIVSNGNATCTGSMVNNTAEDGTPYFLTANHCLGGGVGGWVFYFNHESATCDGNTGPTNQSLSGAQLRASNSGSDFALLELNSDPPDSYDVFFNGWDRSGNTPTSLTGIHHPSGDVKKISHDYDSPSQTQQSGAAVWYLDQWEEGTTEGGSSGSPLFDQNNRVIGQLYGGFASCTNIDADWYGRFDVSWDGSSASTRLRDWLDPIGSNPLVLDGLGGAPLLNVDASVVGFSEVASILCNESTIEPSFTLRNNGVELLTSVVIELVLNGGDAGTINWSGSLETGETELVQLPVLNLVNGPNILTVTVTQPNGVSDQNPTNNVATFEFAAYPEAVEYGLELVLDNFGSETTWVIIDENENIVHAGGPYINPDNTDPWTDGTDGQEESETLCLGLGCYTFVIQDDYGDGMCCEYGNGSYTFYDHIGNELASGGQFDEDESFNFCVTTVSVEENDTEPEFTLFPNPASSEVTLQFPDGIQGEMDLMITDVMGRTIFNERLSNAQNQFTLNTGSWAGGLYLVQLNNNGNKSVQRLVVTK